MMSVKAPHAVGFGLPNRTGKWLALVAGLLIIGVVAFVILPALSDFMGFREVHNMIIEEKIEAGAWYYIFVDKIKDIEPAVRDTMQYTPRKF